MFTATPPDWKIDPVHPRHTPPLPSTYKPVTAHTTSFLTPCDKGDHMSSTTNEDNSKSDVNSSIDHVISSNDHVTYSDQVNSSDDESYTDDTISDHVSHNT